MECDAQGNALKAGSTKHTTADAPHVAQIDTNTVSDEGPTGVPRFSYDHSPTLSQDSKSPLSSSQAETNLDSLPPQEQQLVARADITRDASSPFWAEGLDKVSLQDGSSSVHDKGNAHTVSGTSNPVVERNVINGVANVSQEQQLCFETHGASCPLLDKMEKFLGTIRNQEEEIKLKEQEASLAQRKLEEMTKVKDQQDMELIDLAQIAQNLQKRLRKREEELEVREREIKDYKIHIHALTGEYEKLRQNYIRNHSYDCTHQQEPWKRKEADLRRHKERIHQLYCENEELKKSIKNWAGSTRFFEAEYKKLRHSQAGGLARQHEVEVVALREQVSKYEHRHRELQDRMQMAERIVAEHARVDTALYQDDEATPALLQGMADAVKSSISMCASKIVKFADQHSLPINFADEHMDTIKGHSRKQVVKMAFQAILCEVLFHSFESCTFSFSVSPSNVPFKKPEVRRKGRLHSFQGLRHLDPVEICERSSEFALFVQEKWKLVLNKLAPGQDDISKLIDSSCPFYVSYLRLAKAIWLLHEVAFACEPASAEIFRVPPKLPFMDEYMTEHEDTQVKAVVVTDGEGEGGERRRVALMNVPGFTLRKSIVKSVVCCFDLLIA